MGRRRVDTEAFWVAVDRAHLRRAMRWQDATRQEVIGDALSLLVLVGGLHRKSTQSAITHSVEDLRTPLALYRNRRRGVCVRCAKPFRRRREHARYCSATCAGQSRVARFRAAQRRRRKRLR